MRVATITETKVLEAFILSQITEDLSCKASMWFLPTILTFSDGGRLLPIGLYSTRLNIALSGLEDNSAKSTESVWREAISYKAKTPLGQKLWAIRARIVASGSPMLSWEEIEKEIVDNRGQHE